MEITPETIMPDGRPFFAWENELRMCRNDYQKNQRDRSEIENLMTILHVVEVEEQKQPHDGDYLFRIRRNSILDANSAGQALATAEIERISTEGAPNKYELAKELKEAGFPWLEEYERGADPTLSQLIEACGERFENLERVSGKWIAQSDWGTDPKNPLYGSACESGEGSTPEEAVARLWLALNTPTV